eukprot:10623973-Alexandrium_andersonii.AAC.1
MGVDCKDEPADEHEVQGVVHVALDGLEHVGDHARMRPYRERNRANLAGGRYEELAIGAKEPLLEQGHGA